MFYISKKSSTTLTAMNKSKALTVERKNLSSVAVAVLLKAFVSFEPMVYLCAYRRPACALTTHDQSLLPIGEDDILLNLASFSPAVSMSNSHVCCLHSA